MYRRTKIAFLTGWTLEYIDAMGALDQEAVLQIHDAEQSARRPSKKKGKR